MFIFGAFGGTFSPLTPKKMGISRIIVFLASGTSFFTQTHSLGHRMMVNGSHFYIIYILYE